MLHGISNTHIQQLNHRQSLVNQLVSSNWDSVSRVGIIIHVIELYHHHHHQHHRQWICSAPITVRTQVHYISQTKH